MAILLFILIGDRAAWLIAMAETPNVDPVSLIIGYGPLGAMFVLYMTGQIPTKREVQHLEKQIVQLQADNHGKDELIRAFQIQLTGHTLPALAQSARVFESIPKAVPEVEELRQARDEIAALARQLEALTKGDAP